MRTLVAALVIIAAVPLTAAAQTPRVIVPIIVNRPPAAGTTQITIQGAPSVAGSGAVRGATRGASTPATAGEVRIITRPVPAAPVAPNVSGRSSSAAPVAPNVSGRSSSAAPIAPNLSGSPGASTRVTVQPVPGSAGYAGAPPVRGSGSSPAFTEETRITIRQSDGTGAPPTTQEIRVRSRGGVETPILVVPE
jgi:hypothetical protein